MESRMWFEKILRQKTRIRIENWGMKLERLVETEVDKIEEAETGNKQAWKLEPDRDTNLDKPGKI